MSFWDRLKVKHEHPHILVNSFCSVFCNEFFCMDHSCTVVKSVPDATCSKCCAPDTAYPRCCAPDTTYPRCCAPDTTCSKLNVAPRIQYIRDVAPQRDRSQTENLIPVRLTKTMEDGIYIKIDANYCVCK